MNSFRPAGRAERTDNLQQSQSAYARALTAGNAQASGRVIEQLLNRRCSLGEIYSQVITPSLVSIGDLWCIKVIGVADEHLATQIVLRHLDRLSSLFSWQDGRAPFRVLVACVEGERHYIGARMFTDLCLSHGWSAEFLGPDVPNDALVDTVKKRAPHVVALSATMAQGSEHMRRLTGELSALAPAPTILWGGQAIAGRTPNLPAHGGAVALARDAVDGLEIALKFLRANRPKVILKEYLLALGRRVRELRLKRGWTQEQLADAARVARVCIVAVEGGKQNVSMDIVIRLANALGVLPQALMIDDAEPMQA
ncbi:MAG TPA: cobalamin-dependent protein [Candidatus Binatia bacterium]|jgi:methanogenic corrinoid protein MtbC1/DNA-binding XRE family transcriptional regulator